MQIMFLNGTQSYCFYEKLEAACSASVQNLTVFKTFCLINVYSFFLFIFSDFETVQISASKINESSRHIKNKMKQ